MKKKLVVPNSEPLQFHTTMTELLSVIREEHTSCGYGREKRTLRKAAHTHKKKEANLTGDQVRLYVRTMWNLPAEKSSEEQRWWCGQLSRSVSLPETKLTSMICRASLIETASERIITYPHPHFLSVPMCLGGEGGERSGGWLHRLVGACVHVLYYRSV